MEKNKKKQKQNSTHALTAWMMKNGPWVNKEIYNSAYKSSIIMTQKQDNSPFIFICNNRRAASERDDRFNTAGTQKWETLKKLRKVTSQGINLLLKHDVLKMLENSLAN